MGAQAVTRAIADRARSIRVPVHMIEQINKLNRFAREIMQRTGKEADPAELAERMEMTEEKVRSILRIAKEPISMETPVGEDGDTNLGDMIADSDTATPADAAMQASLREVVRELLDELSPREARCCACASASTWRPTTRWKKSASSSTSPASASVRSKARL